MELRGRTISKGVAEGEALTTSQPISFYGGVNPDTGRIIEKGHELEGEIITSRILVFPNGKGSTVGSYTLYRMKKNGTAPVGIINQDCETVVAVGTIISDIPCMDKVDISQIHSGDLLRLDNGVVTLKNRRLRQ